MLFRLFLLSNARSRQVAARAGARTGGQIEVIGLTWDRYMGTIATDADTRDRHLPNSGAARYGVARSQNC